MSKYIVNVNEKDHEFEDFGLALNKFNEYENSEQSVTVFKVNHKGEKVQLLNNLENPMVLTPLVEKGE